jgi:hypothetical protein
VAEARNEAAHGGTLEFTMASAVPPVSVQKEPNARRKNITGTVYLHFNSLSKRTTHIFV